jgi:2-polyprenyl-6-methoxyphenol hydroxylase-like FAD-dependent oxidoreductase
LIALGENPTSDCDKPVEAWVLDSKQGLRPRKLSARWLVAADGAHSTVRRLLQLPFNGHDLPVPVLRLMLSQLPQGVSELLAGLTYIRHPLGSLSALRMRTDWRLILRPSDAEIVPALADDQWARQRLAEVFAGFSDISVWQELPMVLDHYRVSQRCVEERQQGRCLLIGDAAHITNTRGGLNMNFGLLEGLDLAETLAECMSRDFGDQQRTVGDWARRWQERTTMVLMPRTAKLLDGRRPLEPSNGNRAAHEETTLLSQACLLDLTQT